MQARTMLPPIAPTPAATQERLRALDASLRRGINERISDERLKSDLLARLDQDRDLIAQASVNCLDDACETFLLDPIGEKNKGLVDRQNKTKTMFITRLQGQDGANDINQLLTEMCEVRAGLLLNHLRDLQRTEIERAYNRFSALLGITPTDQDSNIIEVGTSDADLEEDPTSVMYVSMRNGI